MKIIDAKTFAFLIALFKKEKQKLKTELISSIPKPNSGDIGPIGPRGLEGIRGEKGIKGEVGDKGETGKDGPKGPKGDTGESGPTGGIGPQGDKGDSGKSGQDGLSGPRGPKGIQGTQGTSGNNGIKGEKGNIGLPGPAGEKGDIGLSGRRGEKGEKGEKGPRGSKGIQGNTGAPGPTGISGVDGIDGKDGKDGIAGQDAKYDPKELERLKTEFNTYKNITNHQLSTLGGGGSSRILDMDDVIFNYQSQLANNDILIFDKNVQKFTALNIVDIINNIKIELEMQYDKLIDEEVDGTTTFTYIGEASPGGLAANNVWRIKRVGEYANNLTEILWANDSDAFNKIWDNRITYTYNK